jgi:hypothetical protein
VFTQMVWNARRSIDPTIAAFMAAARSAFVDGAGQPVSSPS